MFDAAPEDAWRRNEEFLKAVEFLSPENQEEVGSLFHCSAGKRPGTSI